MSTERSRVNDPEKVIRETFREAGFADGWTDAVLADYRHELAEKIRSWVGPEFVQERYFIGVTDAADLIDPEKRCKTGCACACHTADPSPCDGCSGVLNGE